MGLALLVLALALVAPVAAAAADPAQRALADRHIRERGYLKPVDFPGLPGPAPVMETPLRLSRTPASVRGRAPVLGEHTEVIVGELGYSAEEIASFRTEGVI